MTDLLEYKGHNGSIRYSDEDETLHGKLEFIRDLHRRAMIAARRRDTNLNQIVIEALKTYLEREERVG